MGQIFHEILPLPLGKQRKKNSFVVNLQLFMPLDRKIGGILFLSCLSVVNFNLLYKI